MNRFDATLIEPLDVRILVVADGRLRYDEANYSLSLLTETLKQHDGLLVRFSVSTAYRQPREHIRLPGQDSNGEGSDLPDFRFRNESLVSDFDEVWLFGDQEEFLDASGEPTIVTTQLSADELRIVSKFMENGGGMLATGDHLSLGASINFHLPRVRTMRKWSDGPSATGTEANDTCNGDNPLLQEDAIPQTIKPRVYRTPSSATYPHPVLDSTRGPISVLPDHMHEGECRENLASSDLDEYPGHGNPMPLVVADSRSRSGRPDPSFGAIAAYDGHLGGVGRIVVDSSFHHFVDLNLRGFTDKSTTSQTGTPGTGLSAYTDIQGYFRNLCIWLAPPERQKEIFMRALWAVRWRSRIFGLLQPASGGRDPRGIDPHREFAVVRMIGKNARDALERLTSPSFILLWSLEIFQHLTSCDMSISALYPWRPEHRVTNQTENVPAIDRESPIEFLIGGVMLKLAATYRVRPAQAISDIVDQLEMIVWGGTQIGVKAYRSSLTHP